VGVHAGLLEWFCVAPPFYALGHLPSLTKRSRPPGFAILWRGLPPLFPCLPPRVLRRRRQLFFCGPLPRQVVSNQTPFFADCFFSRSLFSRPLISPLAPLPKPVVCGTQISLLHPSFLFLVCAVSSTFLLFVLQSPAGVSSPPLFPLPPQELRSLPWWVFFFVPRTRPKGA